jgi:hypothetical protein
LEGQQAGQPAIGEATEGEKKDVFRRGLLNDVATACFIKAQALERLDQLEAAKAAYREAAKLTYVR